MDILFILFTMSIVLPLHSTPPPKIEVPKYAGDMPDEDVDHNPDAAPPEPTAPTLDGLSPIPGYQNIGFSGGKIFVWHFTV